MIVYIDENMSPYLAKGFNILQAPLNIKSGKSIEVKSIKEVFGSGAKDEEWIPLAGKQNSCVIPQDYNIKRIRHQRELCAKYNLGMFYFKPPSRNGYTYLDMLKLMVKHWEEITKICNKVQRPFSYKVTQRAGLQKLE